MLWIALVGWLCLIAWSFVALPAMDGADPAVPARPHVGDRRRRLLVAFAGLLLGGAVVVAALVSSRDQWRPLAVVALIAVLSLGGEAVAGPARGMRLGGSSAGLLLAVALLGPAPAVAMGLGAAGVHALRRRVRGAALLCNLATSATLTLLGGLVLYALRHDAPSMPASYPLAVFGVFLAAGALGSLMTAAQVTVLNGGALADTVRSSLLPALPWEIAAGACTALAVDGYDDHGAWVLGVFALALGACQVLLRVLLDRGADSAPIERRARRRRDRQASMLGLLLETLALRDPGAARHAAAVAHYAHELARAAGLSEREQAVVHTAGLLHDLGKEALPDHILLGRTDLHPGERRLIERHPADGARLLDRVEGMEEVAVAVASHHERIDGRGYPRGLSGASVPTTARILAVAEVYDVLTAPDSYREPLQEAEAEEELRQVAGAQLDDRFVHLFTTQVLGGRHAEHRERIADLETELQVQRRVRGVLDQPFALG